ncbi:hypothetical protein D3C72_1554000 [compost metagenome]
MLQVVDVALPVGLGAVEGRLIDQPAVRHQADDALDFRIRQARSQFGIHLGDAAGERQQHVVADQHEGLLAGIAGVGPVVMEVHRRAVVDQIQLAVPHHQVRIARGAVDVAGERIEPDDARGQVSVHRHCRRVVVDRAGQVIQTQVQALAGADQVLDLRVGLGAGELAVQLHEQDLRNRQAHRACHLARNKLGDQRLWPLAGTTELEYGHAVVVGLDHGGQ